MSETFCDVRGFEKYNEIPFLLPQAPAQKKSVPKALLPPKFEMLSKLWVRVQITATNMTNPWFFDLHLTVVACNSLVKDGHVLNETKFAGAEAAVPHVFMNTWSG